MKKSVASIFAAALLAVAFAGCGTTPAASSFSSAAPTPASSVAVSKPTQESVTLLIAAAASLEYSYKEELIPMFRGLYPYIEVEGTYDSSGKLQTQIEQGLAADVFMPAANKQMAALAEQGLINPAGIVPLLENQIVLIVPAGSQSGMKTFEDIALAKSPALGDPESVPAGQYAKEALENLGLWDEVSPGASYGTNVTEVLSWVAQGSADAGIVYATDAATTPDVAVVAAAPEGALAQKVVYPVGVLSGSASKAEAELFVEFLQSDAALRVFEKYGFAPAG